MMYGMLGRLGHQLFDWQHPLFIFNKVDLSIVLGNKLQVHLFKSDVALVQV